MARKSVTYNPPPHHALRGDQGVLLEQVRSIWLPTRLSHSLGVLVGVLSALVLAVSAEMPQLRWAACPPVAAVLAMLLLRFGVAWENDAIDAFDADTVLDRNNAWLLPVGLYSAAAAAVTSFCCCTIFRGSISFVGAMSVSLALPPAPMGLFVSIAVVFLLPLCLHVMRRSAKLGSVTAAWRASVARKGSWTASAQHFLAMREKARILEEPESDTLRGGSSDEDRARRLRDVWGRYVVRTGERHDPDAKRALRERVERETSAFLAFGATALKEKRHDGTAAEAFVGGGGGAPATSISDTDAGADKLRSENAAEAHGASRTKTTTTTTTTGATHRRLPQAHIFFCVASCLTYVYLFLRGVEHAAVAFGFTVTPYSSNDTAINARFFFLQRDVLQLALLYGLESTLALCGGGSTLSGWRVIDFLLHHLPYAVVVGGAALAKVPVFEAYPRTLPLTLLTCPNEAITIAFGHGLSRTFDSPNRLYLLLLMLLLVPVELAETLSALAAPLPTPMPQLGAMKGGASWESVVPMRIVALLTLGAPLYHIFGVIPCCWRKLSNKRSLLANSFDNVAVSPPPLPSPTADRPSLLDEPVMGGCAAAEAPAKTVTDQLGYLTVEKKRLLLLNLATIASLREGDKLRCWAKSADRHRAVKLAVDRRGPLQGLARVGLRDPHGREHRDKNIESVARVLGVAMQQLADPGVPEHPKPKSSAYCKKALRDALQAANQGLGYYKATYANDDAATRKIEGMRNNLSKIQ